jgi:hypothetical protein
MAATTPADAVPTGFAVEASAVTPSETTLA